MAANRAKQADAAKAAHAAGTAAAAARAAAAKTAGAATRAGAAKTAGAATRAGAAKTAGAATRAGVSEIPLPGAAVRGSESGRPIMALLDLLGRRWALRTIWELRDGPLPFRALQERCAGMSSSVLNERLRELRAVGVVDAGAGGYRLTEEGQRLLELFGPLNDWAERWATRTKS